MTAKTTGRGDVIVVADDGWSWSAIERQSFNWIIIKTTTPIAKCRTMRVEEPGIALINPYLWMLNFYLDLDALILLGFAIPSANDAASGKQKGQKRTTESISISEAQFDAVKISKTKIQDPAVIG